jgi:choline dehydrogenase-like flavoprotein
LGFIAVYYDRAGKIHEQAARIVVICCNGIGAPRLLLNSKSNLFPNGLANSSGLVGRNFMLHPFRFAEGIFEERIDSYNGPFGIPAFSQQFYETDSSRGFLRGYSFLLERSFGPLHHAWGGFSGHPVPWGADHHRVMRERFPHVVRVSVLGEDLPEENNRVEIDPELKDPSGIPAPARCLQLQRKQPEDARSRRTDGKAGLGRGRGETGSRRRNHRSSISFARDGTHGNRSENIGCRCNSASARPADAIRIDVLARHRAVVGSSRSALKSAGRSRYRP